MRLTHLAALLAALGTPIAYGQGYRDPNFIPRVNVAVGYNYIRANAPPAGCECFNMNGVFVSAGYAVWPWLTAAGEVTGNRATNIGPLGQNLTLTTYTAGPRVTLHYAGFTPFVQALFGAGHGSDSYFPTVNSYSTSATSFAYTAGGGVDFKVSHRFDRRPQVQYLHTGFPNGTSDNSQNHLVFGAGIVFKFGGEVWTPDPGRQRQKAYKAMHDADVAAMRPAPPPPAPAAGPVPAMGFGAMPVASTRTVAVSLATPTTEEFHASVPDAYFSYDSASLQTEGEQAVRNAAAWLAAHPGIHMEIGGYADERGTQDYNLTLAAKRAEVTRAALVSEGVAGTRLTTHSYGKLVQTCDEREESCYRQNRRAAFNMQP